MKILSVESSASSASVAIIENALITGEIFLNSGLKHSKTLLPAVKNLLELCKTEISDIDLFAVSTGPGSFTGIRIGISAIKGMAQALNKKCLGISSLEALAYPLRQNDAVILSAIDARRDVVYLSGYYFGKTVISEGLYSIEELKDFMPVKKNAVLTGDGSLKVFKELSGYFKNLSVSSVQTRYLTASSIGLLANERLALGALPVSADNLDPSYILESQAEREQKER